MTSTPTVPPSAKRTTTEEVPDKAELARRKKAKQNADRPRHRDYESDQLFADILKLTATLVQVQLATVNPYPSKEETKTIIKQQFQVALVEHEVSEEDALTSGYILGTEEIRVVRLSRLSAGMLQTRHNSFNAAAERGYEHTEQSQACGERHGHSALWVPSDPSERCPAQCECRPRSYLAWLHSSITRLPGPLLPLPCKFLLLNLVRCSSDVL